jgi:hypothetical protein
MKKTCTLGNCRFQVLSEKDRFVGIGSIWIGRTAVRSGRLPLSPYTQSFRGHELSELKLLGVDESPSEIRIRTQAVFKPLPVKILRDHSFDPIHETSDWDKTPPSGTASLDIVLRQASDSFDGTAFGGFSYHYEYNSETIPVFYFLDKASWELDGDIAGTTVVTQSSCSAPVVVFDDEKKYTTEGVIHWDDPAALVNPVMTHNLPRWASHQAFDFQFKGNKTLIGVFEQVELIRSILQRDQGKAELKTFDKHIFDQTLQYKTVAKSILLNVDKKSPTDQKNLWTRIIDEIHNRARAEFALAEEPLRTRLSQNYWANFTYDSYRKDLIPAAENLGFESIFIDNVNKSAMTEESPLKGVWNWNMCCGHEYEPAPKLGGPELLKKLMDDCKSKGLYVFSWTNNDQALGSPKNRAERDAGNGWYLLLEDTRQKWGGAYMGCMSILNFRNPEPRNWWIECLKKNKATTGLEAYLFDSFYNLGFFPVNYDKGTPATQWKQLVGAFKELQDAGVHFLIESFGPFGSPAHGCPMSFGDADKLFAAYKLTVSLGYTTVPTNTEMKQVADLDTLYTFLAHMVGPNVPLHKDGKRIDQVWGDAHKRALADYRENRPHMHKRYLQEDGQSVLWHDKEGKRATLWNFADRQAALPGGVHDLTANEALAKSRKYPLKAFHTYAITDADQLPTTVR